MTYILSLKTKKALKKKVEENSRNFQGIFKDLHKSLKTFQGKMEHTDFLRTLPKIQGLFKTVRALSLSSSPLSL